ncbi:MAG: TonB-dependent receptor [Anditalea sp.]
MKYFLLFLSLFLSISQAFSQGISIYGSVHDSNDESTFPGATVVLEHPADSTMVKGAVTDVEGRFVLDGLKTGKYILKVKYVGYKQVVKSIALQQQDLNLGKLALKEETTTLQEFTINGRRSLGMQKGDTTQFNADAFKTLQDASAQNLVEKMPGISLQDGNIQAQGENVVQVLVDGKPFFGNDAKVALQNLPAEVIESVQIFDKKSDKAELSGFDDGEQEKTINIVTKPYSRKGLFGKASVGYGTNGRYLVGTSINAFNEDQRITVTGLSNNINALDYSGDPNSQGETRPQNGIINTNTLGINFSDDWGEKIEISGSYLFSNRENVGNESLVRDYVLPSDEGQLYTEESNNNRKNIDHRFNMRFEYNIDSNNRVLIRPNVSAQFDKENSYFTGSTVTDSGPLNQTQNTLTAENSDFDFDNRIYYSRRFRKSGRSLTLGLYTGNDINEDDDNREADNIFYGAEDREETLNQHTTRSRRGFSWEADFSYTEPIGKNGMVEIEYEIGNRLNDSDKLTYNIYGEEETSHTMNVLDTALSNTFNSEYLSQEVEIGYQYALDKFRVQVEAEYQHAKMKNDQEFPRSFDMERSFQSILPTLRIDYEISESKKIEFDYDTDTDAPSIGDLQDVIDNSNPLHLHTGNPDLNQSYRNRFRARYRSNNQETDRSFFAYVQSSFEDDKVSNSTTIAEEPTELGEGIILERGSQLSRPINLDGYWDLRSYVNYGMPVDFIKSNFSLNGGINYTHRPGMINNEINFVNSSRFRGGFSLSSNISDKVDFNISTRSTYNVVENSLRPTLNNNYFNQTTQLNYNWILWQGFVFRMDLRHQINTGLAEGYDNSFLLMNMSFGKKLFKNERAEISLNVYDLFGQNNNIRRNVTELYIEDVQSNVLQRYVLLSFSYNLRHFSKGTNMNDYEEIHN